MHNNYYVLRQLSAALGNRLRGSVLSQCFSQCADELILQFETTTKPFFIRASLQPDFCCLSFPDNFKRARKNSIDLFPEIIGGRVNAVRQSLNDRSFRLEFDHQYTLLFKMYGNRANIILFNQSTPEKIFRNHLLQDWSISLQALDKSIDFTKPAFESNLNDLTRYYVTFDRSVWDYLTGHDFYSKSAEEKWELFTSVLNILENPVYSINREKDGVSFSLLPQKDPINSFTDPVVALQHFFVLHHTTATFNSEKRQAIRLVETQLHQIQKTISAMASRLIEIEQDSPFSMWADLLMANLSTIPSGQNGVILTDFYHDNKPVEIKLKKELTAQKNAEVYYRKAKNREQERRKLEEAIALKKQQADALQNQREHLEQADDVLAVRKFMSENNLMPPDKTTAVVLPYREVEFNGFKIWIGKNAQSNDSLTQKFTYKEDLWLHAKDVSGSHVVIKYQAGKPFPKPVIERAAQLAAWYSKRKTDSLCPVTVTQKKFVRKRKGDPPGAVRVDREQTLLVEPKP